MKLEGRGSFDNFKFARVGACLGSRIGRSICYGQSKIVLRHVLSASAAQAQKQIDAIGNKIAEYNAQGKDYMTLSERVQDPYARGLLESKEGELLAKRDANSLSSGLFGTENPYYTSPTSSYTGIKRF